MDPERRLAERVNGLASGADATLQVDGRRVEGVVTGVERERRETRATVVAGEEDACYRVAAVRDDDGWEHAEVERASPESEFDWEPCGRLEDVS